MKSVHASVAAFIAGNPSTFLIADAYTFTLSGGLVLRYTNAQTDLTIAGVTWVGSGPTFQRSTIRQVRGVEVDTLDVTVGAQATDLVNGVPFIQALRIGLFDGATVLLQRFFFTAAGSPVNTSGTGDLVLFSGRVADLDLGRFEAKIRCNSDLELLNMQLPRSVYQPGCRNTVYDAQCALVKATWKVSSAALTGSTASAINVSMAQAAGWFDEGVLTFTSGVNNGVTRSIRTYIGGVITPLSAFPAAPAPGDTFDARPGCNKSQSTCASKFSNLANFRGEPYVPLVTSVVNV